MWFKLMFMLAALCTINVSAASDTNDYILKELLKLRVQFDKMRDELDSVKTGVSTTYVRWGRTTCEGDAVVVYRGHAASGYHRHSGSGSNYLCLHEKPQNRKFIYGEQFYMSVIYGVEYEIYDRENDVFSYSSNNGHAVGNHAAPCVVCLVPNKSTTVMIPARTECPAGWNREYGGYVMAEHYTHARGNFLCWDEAPETAAGASNQDQARVYPTEVRCGSLPCGKYVNGLELTCVVCTK